MPRVARLYKFPIKGLTPCSVDQIHVASDGAVEGDRVLGFLFADAGESDQEGWRGKASFLTMGNTPGFAKINARYDSVSQQLFLTYADRDLAAGDVRNESDRKQIVEAITDLVQEFEINPFSGHENRLPLRLVGDGMTPRFHDRKAHQITLVSSASIEALSEHLGEALDERRFRMNVTIDGAEPWDELNWIGQTIEIGGSEFEVTGTVVRCLATHANPTTGERDHPVMQTLTQEFDQEKPTMGVLARPRAASVLRIGDEVVVT